MNTFSLNHIISMILFVGAAQGLVLSTVLFTGKRKAVYANRILGLNLLVFSLIISLFLLRPKDSDVFCFSCLIVQILFFLLGPLIYFYVKALTDTAFQLTQKTIRHLVIFGGVIFIYGVYFYLYTDPIQSFSGRIEAFTRITPLVSRILAFHMLSYLIYSFFILKEHARRIKQTHSFQEKINLAWLRFLLCGYMVIWISAIYFDVLGSGCGYNAWSFLSVLFSIFMYVMGYMGLQQPAIFSGSRMPDVKAGAINTDKYQKSALTAEMIQIYAKRLETVMKTQKPYLENDLTLSRLASVVSVSTHHLSQVINEFYKQNFFEYINAKRIDEARQLLVSPEYQHQNIAEVCFKVGFNSVSAFNAAFKKFTGTTPSRYRKEKIT